MINPLLLIETYIEVIFIENFPKYQINGEEFDSGKFMLSLGRVFKKGFTSTVKAIGIQPRSLSVDTEHEAVHKKSKLTICISGEADSSGGQMTLLANKQPLSLLQHIVFVVNGKLEECRLHLQQGDIPKLEMENSNGLNHQGTVYFPNEESRQLTQQLLKRCSRRNEPMSLKITVPGYDSMTIVVPNGYIEMEELLEEIVVIGEVDGVRDSLRKGYILERTGNQKNTCHEVQLTGEQLLSLLDCQRSKSQIEATLHLVEEEGKRFYKLVEFRILSEDLFPKA